MTTYSTLFLDLDETLYPHSNGLWLTIGHRINDFMTNKLGISKQQAQELRSEYLTVYGTTLNGLRANYAVDVEDYLEYVHDVPIEDFVEEDLELRAVLEQIQLLKIIYTNAHRTHADRVLTALGVVDQIDMVIDLYALEFKNKPQPDSYQRALFLAGNPTPGSCIFADDRTTNLIPASEIGMTTVLVGKGEIAPGVSYHIERITLIGDILPSYAKRSQGTST